ncbi:MAG: hypothetical protein LBJ64_04265 [Deltaproteobacteria bacterium]|jgi:hypothetical protein|nr:hypothetical protein [Deltaproteobacteria bacterium]
MPLSVLISKKITEQSEIVIQFICLFIKLIYKINFIKGKDEQSQSKSLTIQPFDVSNKSASNEFGISGLSLSGAERNQSEEIFLELDYAENILNKITILTEIVSYGDYSVDETSYKLGQNILFKDHKKINKYIKNDFEKLGKVDLLDDESGETILEIVTTSFDNLGLDIPDSVDEILDITLRAILPEDIQSNPLPLRKIVLLILSNIVYSSDNNMENLELLLNNLTSYLDVDSETAENIKNLSKKMSESYKEFLNLLN